MPRLIWVFAGRTLTLFVLSRGGSYYMRLRRLPSQYGDVSVMIARLYFYRRHRSSLFPSVTLWSKCGDWSLFLFKNPKLRGINVLRMIVVTWPSNYVYSFGDSIPKRFLHIITWTSPCYKNIWRVCIIVLCFIHFSYRFHCKSYNFCIKQS